jgi:hypothetical protein
LFSNKLLKQKKNSLTSQGQKYIVYIRRLPKSCLASSGPTPLYVCRHTHCTCTYAYHTKTVKHTLPYQRRSHSTPRARRKLTIADTNKMQARSSTAPILSPCHDRGDDPAVFLHPLARAARLEHSLLLSARGDCLALLKDRVPRGPHGERARLQLCVISSAPV